MNLIKRKPSGRALQKSDVQRQARIELRSSFWVRLGRHSSWWLVSSLLLLSSLSLCWIAGALYVRMHALTCPHQGSFFPFHYCTITSLTRFTSLLIMSKSTLSKRSSFERSKQTNTTITWTFFSFNFKSASVTLVGCISWDCRGELVEA